MNDRERLLDLMSKRFNAMLDSVRKMSDKDTETMLLIWRLVDTTS